MSDDAPIDHPKVQKLRDRSDYLVDRYSERKESAEELSKRVNQRFI